MPYGKFTEDGLICIYKVDAEKNKIGESLGCHETEAEADKQLAALYVSDPGLSTGKRCIRAKIPITVVDAVEGVIRGYVFIWGDPEHRDAYETYFDKARPPELDLDLLPIALRYEHGQDGAIQKDRVGEIREIGFDDKGAYFIGYLNRDGPYFERVVNEVKYGTANGPLRTSSGTGDYLADFYEDGAFKYWPVNEVSLTAFAAEERMPNVVLVRSETGRDAPELDPATDALQEQGSLSPEGSNLEQENDILQENSIMIEKIMEILQGLPEDADLMAFMAALLDSGLFTQADLQEAVGMLGTPESEEEALSERNENPLAIFAQALAQVMDAKAVTEAADEARSMRAKNRQLEAQVALLQQQAPPVRNHPQPQGDTTNGGRAARMEMRDMRYDHLSAKEMALGYILMRSKYREGMFAYDRPVSEDYYQALRSKAIEHVDRGASSWKDRNNWSAARSAAYRANEIMGPGASQEGYDWITTYYPSQLWEIARASRIMDQLESAGLWTVEVQQGANNATVMLEGSDPTWYTAGANASVDATTLTSLPQVTQTQATTANQSVTPGKLMVRILVDTELIEDSIIPMLPQLSRQMEESAKNQVEYVFLNGDTATTASTNINLIDSTPGTAPSAPSYLVCNGALKYALVTGSSTSRSGTTFTSADFKATRALLPDANAADPEKILYISDITTGLKALELTDVKTYSELAGDGTIITGRLPIVYGTKYLQSAQMALAYTEGKISNTAANNTKGRILCVYPYYWALVWKRQMTFKQAEDIEGDVTKLVGTMRLAFVARGAGASTCTYNLTVS